MSHGTSVSALNRDGSKATWLLTSLLLCLLGLYPPSHAIAQVSASATSNALACRATQIELYDLGGEGGTGHTMEEIGFRNISADTCVVSGVPAFRVIGTDRQPHSVPYGKNAGNYMFQPQPDNPVTLAPGAFAGFLIGWSVCEDDASPDCTSLQDMEISLPDDSTWLRVLSVAGYQGEKISHIDVSAIGVRPGSGYNPQWQPPVVPVALSSGALPQLDVSLYMPTQAQEDSPLHFTIQNRSGVPQMVDWDRCILNERLTNSAGKVLTASGPCPASLGPIGPDGKLPAGAIASKDSAVPQGDIQLCRQGIWHEELQLVTTAGTLNFNAFDFNVESSYCSDSSLPENLQGFTAKDIRWTPISHGGVSLGLVARAAGNADPGIGTLSTGLKIPAFRVGEPIELHLFVDNLSDAPITMRLGPDDIRLYVRRAGRGVPATEVAPKSVLDESVPMGTLTVPPHTQQFMGTRLLTNRYVLPPGQYDVLVGLRTLQGVAKAANAPAAGPLYAAVDAARANALIEIVP